MGIATVYLDRTGALTEPPRVSPCVKKGMLKLRGSDPPVYAYAEIHEVLLGRQAITLYGNYVVSAPSIILGEYWAEDGITRVALGGQCPHKP